jgi:hypothetical protein
MQKLTGTSSEKITKVVGLFTTNQQNWFCIFLIFLRFSTQFTRISKNTLLFQIRFCSRGPGSCRLLHIYPFFAYWPSGKLEPLQCGPRARPARLRPNSGEGRRRGRSGTGRGAVLGLLGTGFDRSPRRWGSWRSRAAVAAAVRPAPTRLRPGTTGGVAR